jgi:hypothetical protein
MSGAARAELWTLEGVAESPEWVEVRSLAATAYEFLPELSPADAVELLTGPAWAIPRLRPSSAQSSRASRRPWSNAARSCAVSWPMRLPRIDPSTVASFACISDGRSSPAAFQSRIGLSPGCGTAARFPVIDAMTTSGPVLYRFPEATAAGRHLIPDRSVKSNGTRTTAPLRRLVVDRVLFRLPVPCEGASGERRPAALVIRLAGESVANQAFDVIADRLVMRGGRDLDPAPEIRVDVDRQSRPSAGVRSGHFVPLCHIRRLTGCSISSPVVRRAASRRPADRVCPGGSNSVPLGLLLRTL